MILNGAPFPSAAFSPLPPGALAAFERSGDAPADFIRRHANRDWGNVCSEDWARNRRSPSGRQSHRVVLFGLKDSTAIWIITEWDRSASTILLPDEYWSAVQKSWIPIFIFRGQ